MVPKQLIQLKGPVRGGTKRGEKASSWSGRVILSRESGIQNRMTIGSDHEDAGPLRAGPSLWRVEPAHRLAVLMEHDEYFDALSEALHQAEKSIMVLGWQFDPRTRLEPEAPSRRRQDQVGQILRRLVKQKPELEVRLLIWKSPLLIAASQGFYPHRGQKWFRRRYVHFRLDMARVIGACHHQKVVVIDDKLAFCGGGDIATDRWDTDQHLDDDPRRCQPSGLYSPPRHEVMCLMQGPVAKALGDLARERWHRATHERLAPVGPTQSDPWPTRFEPLLEQVPVGIARTEPGLRNAPEVRENETLYLEMIAQAQKLIYLENQYFTSPTIAEALARRLAESDGPEIVLVSTAVSPSWFDGLTMDTARAAVLHRLEQADIHGRFYAFCPRTRGGERIIVHAKMAIVDDRLLRIGSTNLNNRSQGLDTECDVVTEAADEEGQAAIRRFRHRTIGHFLGVSAKDMAAAEAVMGSVGHTIETYGGERMKALGTEEPSRIERFIAQWQLGDPRSSHDAWRPWRRVGSPRAELSADPPAPPQNP